MNNSAHDKFGRFVCVRPNKNGEARVLFIVPSQLRPQGWPASIRLPELGPWKKSLDDPSFKAAVAHDAARLNSRLDEQRRQAEIRACGPGRTLVELVQIYLRSDQYRELGQSRKYRNKRSVEIILRWSESRGHPDVKDITRSNVEDFLSIYDDRPSVKYDMRSIWNNLFDTAVNEQWCRRNPVDKRKWNIQRARAVQLWKDDDVELYASVARQQGQPALAAMLVAMMRTGQRPGDMREARWGVNCNGERFIFRQAKTRAKVNVPITKQVRELLESVRVPGSDFVFTDGRTGRNFSQSSLTARFGEVRLGVVARGGSALLLQTLRHSAVMALIDAGASAKEIAAATGHLYARVEVILERYAPDREGLAERGMRKANLARGGSDSDFTTLEPSRFGDWDSDGQAQEYRTPASFRHRPGKLEVALKGLSLHTTDLLDSFAS